MSRHTRLSVVASTAAVLALTPMTSFVGRKVIDDGMIGEAAPSFRATERVFSVADAATLSLTDANCPVCSGSVLARLDTARLYSMDIEGRDMYGHTISHYAAGGKWYPFDESDKKQTICGKLDNFDYNEGDYDWEFNIVPSGPYAELFERAKTTPMWPPVIAKCDGKCVHAEINPDGDFPTNDLFKIDFENPTGVPWNTNYPATSDVEGENICVYGPWIRDRGHHNKPEIHPAELTWWRVVPANTRARSQFGDVSQQYYHVMMIQDDRNSFDRESDYNYPCELTSGDFADVNDLIDLLGVAVSTLEECLNPPPFRPWSKNPRRSRVRLAFEVDANGSRVRDYAISERHAHHITTGSDAAVRADQGPGSEYKIEFNGRQILSVREVGNDSHLGVVFSDWCRDAATSKIRGFVNINSKYGDGDRGGEGFHVLDISQSDVTLPPGRTFAQASDSINQAQARFLAQLAARDKVKPHPRLEFIGPRRLNDALVADIAIPLADAARNDTHLRVSRAQGGDRALRVSADTVQLYGDSLVRLVGEVSISRPSLIRIEFADGDSLSIAPPKLGISNGRREVKSLGGRVITRWMPFLRASHAHINLSAGPGQLIHARESAVRIFPRYLVRDDEGTPEEQTSLTRLLNAAVDSAQRDSTGEKLRTLFGLARPFRIEWRFKAMNLSSGRETVVRPFPDAQTAQLQVDTSHHAPGAVGFKVRFPTWSDSVYRLEAIATITDTYGVSGELSHVLWSHYVSIPDAKRNSRLLRATSVMSGADVLRLATDTIATPNARIVAGAAARQRAAASVVGAVRQTGADGVVTVDEFQQIARATNRLRAIRP